MTEGEKAKISQQLATMPSDDGWAAIMKLVAPRLVEDESGFLVGLVADRVSKANNPCLQAEKLFQELGLKVIVARKRKDEENGS